MAIISEKSFVNGVLKNQSKKTQHPQTAIVNEADFLSRGADEMSRRKTAYENYKKAVEEQRQIWQKNQERRQTQAYAERTDARQDVAAAYGQAGAGTAARRTAYENYTYALRQKEIWQKKLRGETLTPAEEQILNRNVYKSPEKAQQREANQQVNDNLQWAQERRQTRKAQLSEQEFNRSSAMQAQWGNYRNYLRGVYAGYDEAVAKGEQERAKSAAELRSESQALQQRIDEIDAQQRAAWTKDGTASWDAALKEERDALREHQLGLDYRADRKAQEEYKAGRQAARDAEREKYAGWTQEQMQQRIDEIDAQQNAAWTKRGNAGWNAWLEEEKKAIQRQMNQRFPGPLQKAARFAEDAATAFYDAGVAQSMSGFEMARNVAETKVNQGAAWALRDLANAQILKLPGGEKYAEKLRTLADRLSTSYDYTDAQQWNDYYQSIMNEAMQDHSAVGTWIIQQLPSAGAMVNDLMFSTATGGTLTPLSIMGVRAGGSAMNDAHNEGATDTQALLIGLENAATEILSEKLFGGNPVYDEDAGLVNRAVAKLTKSKSVMRVLDSKAFDFVSEGLEEVVAELLEPTFQGMVLNGSLKGTVSWESLGNSFLGGVFLAALGNLAGLPAGLTQAKQERQTRRWASILAENGAKSDSAEVREAAAVLQEKLDYGRTPDIEDIGRTLSAMDNAGQTEAAQEAAQDAKESRAYNQYERAVEDVQRSQAQYDRDTERQRIFQAERDGTITHEQAEAALDSLDQDEAINREEAQRVAARNVQSEAETAEAVGNARARQQSQQARNEAELERQGAARADTAIRSAAQQYGWDERLTGAAAQSYADYNRGGQGAMSAAEYAAAVNEVRRKGADGIRLDAAQRGAQGLPRTIVQTAWEAGRRAGQQNSAAQYSIAKDYGQKLRQWNRDGRPGGASFTLGTTGATLQGLGAVESDIYMNGDKISTILKEHPEISMKEVEKIPEILEDPVLILKSKGENRNGQNTRLVVIGSTKAQNGQPILAALDLRPNESGFILDDMQKVNSAYTKKNPINFVKSSEILFADKKRTIPLLRTMGLQLRPNELQRSGSVGSISYNKQNVNMKGVPFNEMVQSERQGGNNGTTVSDDGGKRNAGVYSGKQTGGVAEGAGRAEAQQGSRSWREEGRELEDRVRAAKQPGKSAKEIGIRNGSTEKSFREVPRELWTPGLQKIADYARKNSVKDVHFFVGKIGVVNQKAQVTRYMNGVAIDGNTLWIRVNDNRVSPEQIARHEIFHSMADRAPNMLEAVQEQITKRLGREKIQALAQRYAEAYEGCYTEAEIEHYLEEICADAYAGIERFSDLSREAMDALRSADGKAQSQKKADSARAPPEKSRYSVEKTTENQPFVEVEQDILDGVPESKWVSTVKENLKKKFPNGITVGNNEISIDKQSRREMTFSRYMQWLYHNDPQTRADKLRATDNADEILRAATGWVNEGLNHPRTDNIRDFARGNVLLRVGGNDYAAEVVVGTRASGDMLLYDVLNMQQASFEKREADAAKTVNPSPGVGRNTASVSENSIRSGGENVKQKYSAAADADQRKAAQFDLIQNSNAAEDDYHTWIRSADEIRTLAETLEDPEWAEYDEYDPDYTRQMAEDAIQSGKITVYSSYKIGNGVFVTPSRMEAESYSANGKVYSKTVNVDDVAWIDPTQGQYAPVRDADIRYSASEQYDYTKAFADQIDDWKAGKIAKNDTLIVGSTPDVFQQIGFNALPVTINQTHVDYAINGTKNAEHHIGEAMLKQLPRAMQSPVAVIASETQGESSVVALLPFIKDAKTVIIPVYVDGFGRQNSVVIDSNAITSIYGRKNAITKLLTNAIEAHNNGETTLFYLDKTKATALYQVARVTMPKMPDANNGFVASIRDAGSNVKPKLQNVTESQQFKRWFGDWQNHPETASKVVNEDGTPKIVYHQTENEFTVFDTRRNGAGTRDNQTPFGIFLKSSDRDIGLRGKNQMALYANIRNPLVAQNRADLTRQLRSISPEYDALMSEHAQLDAEYKQKFEDAKNALVSFLTNWRKEHPGEDSRTLYGTPEFERVYDLEDSVTEEWTNKADDISLKAKEALTNALRQAGYDGIILARDAGSFGRSTDAYIALNPEQVKSATDNVGTFDRNNPDIRYSASEEQAEGQEKKGYTLDTIPKKAQTYLRKAQSNLLYQLERSMRMPLGRNARSVRGLLDNLTNEYLQTGAVTQETMDKSFEAVYAEGMRLEKEFYEKIRTLAPKLKRMEITPTAEEWAALDNPDAFRKRVKGTLNIVDSGGKSVNEVYEAMSKAAPEVFPRGVTGAAEQELALLMGARRMQLAEANTKSYDGTDAAIWKRTAKSDFEAGVKDLMGDLNVARRYAEAQRKTEKTYQGPQTAEEAMELYHELAEKKRNYERKDANQLLTAADRLTIGRMIRGDITPESVRGMENADAILEMYEAKADYELTALKIEEYKRHIGEERVKQARAALGDVSKYKDKRWGLQYSRETQQRNVRDIAPAENAEAINRQYFNPVRKATAEATRLKNRMRERVAALDLSRHRSRGNRISEAAAVQILGEAQDNIRVLENSRGRLEDRDGKTLDEWQGIISQLWQENPNLDRAKIENAVKEFHSIYDELYRMMNETRVRNGYAPVNYRAGYFPHFGVGTSDGILNLMGMGMGIDAGIETLPNDAKGIIRWFLKTRKEERGPDALPTEINGRTRSFRPGITWFANAQERTGFRTAYDAVLGFDRYVEGAANVICYTDAIRNLRTLASQVRYLSANDGLREQEDAIRARQDMTEGQKQLAIDDLKKNGKYALSLWAANLDEYTNLLANKKSTLDRDAESLVNRSVHSFLKKWQSRVAANMVALNPGSWLTNFGVIAQAGAEMKVSSVLKAMQQQAVSHWTQDGFSERSDFLTSRAGSDTLTAGWVDNASKVLSMPMEWIDTYSANVIVRARYMENLQRGMSEEAAMEEADDFAANVMADRSKGAMPTLFESRNPLFKMFTQFQLEVNNTFSYVFKDLPTEQRKKGVGALALALFKFCLQSWLYNELYESLIGRRPMLDPIDLAMEGAAGYAGYERNNAIRAALSGQKWFEKKDEDEHWLNATISLAGELGQELPFIGNLLGGGKLPYMSTFPDLGNVVSTITSEEWTAEQKRAKIWKELKDPVMYWAPPFGGGQIKKTTEAITAARRGGSYAADGTLQYPIYDETAGDQVQKWVTNLVFGKSSTKAAQEWVESGFKNLSRKETAAYQAMIQTDAGQREIYTFVTAMKNVKEKEAKLSMLFAYDLPESGKAAYYYEAIAEDSERERMDALREKGISNEEYVSFRKAYFSEYGTQAVSQERMNAILDKLSLPKSKKAELWRSCGKDWKEENNPYR